MGGELVRLICGGPVDLAPVVRAQGARSRHLVKLLGLGAFTAQGQPCLVNHVSVERLLKQIGGPGGGGGGADVLVGYEHALLDGEPRGPAAGWVRAGSLQCDAAGIFGRVEWALPAYRRVCRQESRYLWPVVERRGDGLVIGLRGLVLSNRAFSRADRVRQAYLDGLAARRARERAGGPVLPAAPIVLMGEPRGDS